jgi:hypothetical protein
MADMIIKMTELTIEKHTMTKQYSKIAEHYIKNDRVHCINDKMTEFSKMAEHYRKND